MFQGVLRGLVCLTVLAGVLTGCAGGIGGRSGDGTVALGKGRAAGGHHVGARASGGATGSRVETGDDAGAGASGAGPGSDAVSSAGTDAAQTLPPGDPGVDAPGTDDPNGDPRDGEAPGAGSDHAASSPPKLDVPVGALIDAETLASIAGSGWSLSTATDGPAGTASRGGCAAPVARGAVGSRSVFWIRAHDTGSATGRLAERVATHADRRAAIASVRAIGSALSTCTGRRPHDPRIGDASIAATVTDRQGNPTLVTAVALEGVTFVLSGTGAVTAADVWSALTDVAQGNTCEAAADGCH